MGKLFLLYFNVRYRFLSDKSHCTFHMVASFNKLNLAFLLDFVLRD